MSPLGHHTAVPRTLVYFLVLPFAMSEMFTSWLSFVIISMLLVPCCPELGHTVSFRNFGQQVNKLTEVECQGHLMKYGEIYHMGCLMKYGEIYHIAYIRKHGTNLAK